MPSVSIDWGTASVDDGQLAVAFEGKPSAEWRERFEAVIDRLRQSSAHFGEIEVGKAKLKVSDVESGSESDLRHLLESAVLQANADAASDEDDGEEPDDERSDEDQGMTDAFRAFAD
jgi:hypothetical protein